MKKFFNFVWFIPAVSLLTACVSSDVKELICPINKSIYKSEETGKTFTINEFSSRVRVQCTEDGKEPFRFTTHFYYPTYKRLLENDNLECRRFSYSYVSKGEFENKTVYLMRSGTVAAMPCCEGVSYSADEIDERRLFDKNPNDTPGFDNTAPYWATDDDLKDFAQQKKLHLWHPLDWDLGPLGKGPYNLVGCTQ